KTFQGKDECEVITFDDVVRKPNDKTCIVWNMYRGLLALKIVDFMFDYMKPGYDTRYEN
ncbi:14571_t:CDS:2, partial [Gigaspora margarita]